MKLKSIGIAALVVGALAVSGCGGNGGPLVNSTIKLRLAHFANNATPINGIAGTTIFGEAVPFGSVGNYTTLIRPNSAIRMVVENAQTGTRFLNEDQTLPNNSGLTYYLYENSSNTRFVGSTSANVTPSGNPGFKFVHVNKAADTVTVDVYVHTTTDNILNINPRWRNVAFGASTPYLAFAPGQWVVTATIAGSKTAVFSSPIQNFASNSAYTGFLYANTQGQPTLLLQSDQG